MDRRIVTLTFSGPLAGDRYRLDVQPTGISGLGGSLDGLWSDFLPGSMTDRYDRSTATESSLYTWRDDIVRSFPSGNGMGGTSFQFKFAYSRETMTRTELWTWVTMLGGEMWATPRTVMETEAL